MICNRAGDQMFELIITRIILVVVEVDMEEDHVAEVEDAVAVVDVEVNE